MTPFTSERHQLALGMPTGYRRVYRVTAARAGSTLELEPTNLSLTQDSRRALRWDGSMTITDPDLQPEDPRSLLTPYGTRVTVEVGLRLSDGTEAFVPYGTYAIGSSRTSSNATNRVTEIGLVDVSERVELYRLEEPLTVASGTDLAQMVNIVVTSRTGFNPAVTDVDRDIEAARTFGLETSTGPWSEIQDVLNSFGLAAWYDRVGAIVIGSMAIDEESSVIDFTNALDVAAQFDIRPPNVIVARGEAPDGEDPVQAIAMDLDPTSPTFAGETPGGSAYGRVTEFFSSPLLTTEDAAEQAAETILAREIGAGFTFSLSRPFDPTIDSGDVIVYGGRRFAVDAVTLDATGDTSLVVRTL